MKQRIKYHGLAIFLSLILVVLSSKLFFVSYKSTLIDYFTDIIGVFFIFIGFFLRISARGLKEELSQCGKMLVTDGAYSIVRHPMYLGIVLIGLGVVLVIFRLWVFLLFIFLFLVFYIPQIRKEEKDLSSKFGETFREYKAKVPLFSPKVKTLLKGLYLPIKTRWIKKELFSLISVFFAVFFFEIWEEKIVEGESFLKEFLFLTVFLILIFLVISWNYWKR